MPLLILPSKNNIDSIPQNMKPDLLQGLWKLEAVAEKKQLAVQLYVMKTGKSSVTSITEEYRKTSSSDEKCPPLSNKAIALCHNSPLLIK